MRTGFQLLSKPLFCWLLCAGLLSLQAVASAQVYKSYDAHGNVVFSDKPSQRSEEVELSKPNLSDAFEVPPPSSSDSAPENRPAAQPPPEPATEPNADDDSADTNNDGRVSRREKDEQRKERRRKKRETEEPAGWYSE
jgi:hypothetical protein